MTDAEINAAIVKACELPGQVFGRDYINDWNAVHAAVNGLNDWEKDRFLMRVCNLAGNVLYATQRDWCEAFLRVKGLWKET